MKINYYDHLQGQALDVATKTEGMAYLLMNYVSSGTGVRDREAQAGVAMILDDLAKQGREIYRKLDSINRPDLDHEIEVDYRK
jgi:hypothetical protein